MYLRPTNKYPETNEMVYKILGVSHCFKLEIVQTQKTYQEERRKSLWKPLKKDICDEEGENEEKTRTAGELSKNQIENFFKELEMLKTDR